MSHRIGIDGGGTKTECILVDDSGTIVSRHMAPGCNPSIVGPKQAAQIVKDALQKLVSDLLLRPSSFVLRTSLICTAGSRVFWREFAAGLTGFGKVVSTDDSLPILELATAGKPGLVLHAGTGSFVAARQETDVFTEGAFYAGGIGWRFGDPGSGYEIGRRAVARALLEMQGWKKPSGLGGIVRQSSGLSETAEIIRHYYDDPSPNAKISSLTPGVLRLAAEGDPAARTAAADSASELLDLAVCVAEKLFPGAAPGSFSAGLSGPILTHPAVMPALQARSPFPLTAITDAPIEGVRRMLLRL